MSQLATLGPINLITKILPSHSLSPSPMSNIGGMATTRDKPQMSLYHMLHNPLEHPLPIPLRRISTSLQTMMTSI